MNTPEGMKPLNKYPEVNEITGRLERAMSEQTTAIAAFFSQSEGSIRKTLAKQSEVAHEAVVLLLGEITIFRKFEASLVFFSQSQNAEGAALATKRLFEELQEYRKGAQELAAIKNTDVN